MANDLLRHTKGVYGLDAHACACTGVRGAAQVNDIVGLTVGILIFITSTYLLQLLLITYLYLLHTYWRAYYCNNDFFNKSSGGGGGGGWW